MITNTIKADAMMMARHMRELAENIEYEIERMDDDVSASWSYDTHRAQAYRDSLSLCAKPHDSGVCCMEGRSCRC